VILGSSQGLRSDLLSQFCLTALGAFERQGTGVPVLLFPFGDSAFKVMESTLCRILGIDGLDMFDADRSDPDDAVLRAERDEGYGMQLRESVTRPFFIEDSHMLDLHALERRCREVAARLAEEPSGASLGLIAIGSVSAIASGMSRRKAMLRLRALARELDVAMVLATSVLPEPGLADVLLEIESEKRPREDPYVLFDARHKPMERPWYASPEDSDPTPHEEQAPRSHGVTLHLTRNVFGPTAEVRGEFDLGSRRFKETPSD
jgi:hypothetical protein